MPAQCRNSDRDPERWKLASLPDQDVERVLVAVAHPDDAEFWAGGTIARWTDAGVEVTYCILTNGDAGGYDPALLREEIPRIRQAEQQKAAALLGVHDVRFSSLAEGELRRDSRDLHLELVGTIRQVRPQVVVTWSPEWNWQRFRSCHPDHLATGRAVLTAIYPDAGNQFALPHLRDDEGLEPWTVREAWLLNSPQREVNHYVDITETFDRKVAAVRAHASQIKDPNTLADRLRERIARNTTAAGLPDGRLAEAFQVVVTG
jgi:LmbE family N-acetylglucosaminyl deacetylase